MGRGRAFEIGLDVCRIFDDSWVAVAGSQRVVLMGSLLTAVGLLVLLELSPFSLRSLAG